MKIAVLSDRFPPYYMGGAEHIAALFTTQYMRCGHDVVVITTVQDRNRETTPVQAGMNINAVYTNMPTRLRAWCSFYNPQVVPMVRTILAREKPDVIHAHNIHNYLSYHVLKVAHNLQIPVVMTLHDAMSFSYGKYFQFIDPHDRTPCPRISYKPLNFWTTLTANRFRTIPFRNLIIRTYLHRYVKTLVAVSRALQKALNAHGITCTTVVPNGVDVAAFAADPRQVMVFKDTYGLHDKRVALLAGRISYLKGGEQALKAMAEVCKALPQAVLLVAGAQNSYAQHMKQMACDAGIGHRVIFTGWLAQPDLLSAYQCCDVVLCPSIYLDNFPTVNLEAMAMKKPVIASCFGGSQELVLDGVTGYIVNPLNTALLAERIIDLLSNKEKAVRMGEEGYQRIVQNFTIQQQGQKMLTLLEEARQST